MTALLVASKPCKNVLGVPDTHRCIYMTDKRAASDYNIVALDAVKMIKHTLPFAGPPETFGRKQEAVVRIGMAGTTAYAQYAARVLLEELDERINAYTCTMPYERVLSELSDAIFKVSDATLRGWKVGASDGDDYGEWAVVVSMGASMWEITKRGVVDMRPPFSDGGCYKLYVNGGGVGHITAAFRAVEMVYRSNYGDIWQMPAGKARSVLLRVGAAVALSTTVAGSAWDVDVADVDGLGRSVDDMIKHSLDNNGGAEGERAQN